MKVVVTGATGFIGRPLVRRLLAQRHEVAALSRDPRRSSELLPFACKSAKWAPDSGAVDAQALRGADAIVHLAGESVAGGRWTPERKRAIRESRVATSRAIVAALDALAPAERPRVMVSASAIGVYGDRAAEILDEQSAPGEGFLANVCKEWEREVFAAQRLGVRAVAIRVGVVLGPDGGALRRMLIPFRLGLGGRIGAGEQWMSWIHLDDAVALFCFALENPSVRGALNGVASCPVTNREFTRELARALKRPALMPLPAIVLRLAFGEMSQMLLASERVIPGAAQQTGFSFRYPDLSGALAQLCADQTHTLEFEQWIPRAPDEVFPFFADPHNLEKITPGFLNFRGLRTSTPQIGEGTEFDYRLSLHGLPIRWQSRIERWEPGRRFIDLQTRGPYKLWEHTHEFEAHDGGTIIRDRVHYELPFGVLGELAGALFVKRDLDAVFRFRRRRIAELFPARVTPAGAPLHGGGTLSAVN